MSADGPPFVAGWAILALVFVAVGAAATGVMCALFALVLGGGY